MHKLPLRSRHDKWEVLVPCGDCEKWIVCHNHDVAVQMAASGNLAFDVVEGNCVGEMVARELEAIARVFSNHGCHERAIWLAEHAKVARGEPSFFDEQIKGQASSAAATNRSVNRQPGGK